MCPGCASAIPPAAAPRPVVNVDRVLAAWDYDDIPRSLVLALKIRGRREAASHLGRGLIERVWAEGIVADVLTWVPARRRDIRARGFDHAEAIARVVAGDLGLPLVPLLRHRGRPVDQTTLDAGQRKANLEGAFVARATSFRVAVVDDLVTTGATLAEAARALRSAGCARVEALVACVVV